MLLKMKRCQVPPAVTQPSFWKRAGSLATPSHEKCHKNGAGERQRKADEFQFFVAVTFEGSIGARVLIDRENFGALDSQGVEKWGGGGGDLVAGMRSCKW
jgi:hypothetical protein